MGGDRIKKEKPRAAVFWSGGKDSYLAMSALTSQYEILYLIATIDKIKRSHAHEFSTELLEAQTKALGLSLITIEVLGSDYKKSVRECVREFKAYGVSNFIFGDVFLKDVREYREEMLSGLDAELLFPLWDMPVDKLVELVEKENLRAVVTAVNTDRLPQSFAGRELNSHFFDDLPADVDAFGENGEFHTFCFDGLLFQYPVGFKKGELRIKQQEFKTLSGAEIVTETVFLEIEAIA